MTGTLAPVGNALEPTRRRLAANKRRTNAKTEQRQSEPLPDKRGKESDPEKAVENVSPRVSSDRDEQKGSSKRGVKRKIEKAWAVSQDAQWKLAAEIVAREKERMNEREQMNQEESSDEEEDLCELDPLTELGIQGLTTHEHASIEKQKFKNVIALHYYKEENSKKSKIIWRSNNAERLDDPFQPDITGARKRKAYFGMLKYWDLPSSKPFHRYDTYNLCVSKTDANGFDQHLLQWFAKPPSPAKPLSNGRE